MNTRQNLPPFVVSVVMHVAVLVVMAMFKMAIDSADETFAIETVVADESREQEEFEQELDTQQEIAESVNFVPGSAATEIGGSEAPIAQQTKIDLEDVIKNPDIRVQVAARNLPGLDTLGDDLGEAEVTGEVSAIVDGYGAALDRLTQELLRLMRSNKLLVVWMFDESESMKDDQAEVKQRIYRVYEELKLVETDPRAIGSSKKKKLQNILLTAVTSFGAQYHVLTPKPTNDPRQVIEAIGRIPVDKSGTENMCWSLAVAINKYRGISRGRKLVIVIISDESGDDGAFVEDALHLAKSARAPLYILGRESVFGSKYAQVRWRQPETGKVFYLPIRRGPETPFPEQLQYDGFRARRDAHMSGFGPYEQVRLARDTGGIFFQLPNEETNINDLDDRKFRALDLKEYLPNLSSRPEYLADRDQSDFRKAIWDVIFLLNPDEKNKQGLNVPEGESFSVNPAKSTPRVAARLKQISMILSVMAAAQQHLEKVRSLRRTEASRRWRANYDLIYAQLFAYRVRLFEYAIGLGQFGKNMPRLIRSPKSNYWAIRHGSRELIMPDAQQEQALGVTADELRDAHARALRQFAQVKEEHPNTPWSRRAEWEEKRQFGATFRDYYVAPPPLVQNFSKPPPKPMPVTQPPKL